jgi:hypothetical protein
MTVIASDSEAIQLRRLWPLDCFVASLLAMTVFHRDRTLL